MNDNKVSPASQLPNKRQKQQQQPRSYELAASTETESEMTNTEALSSRIYASSRAAKALPRKCMVVRRSAPDENVTKTEIRLVIYNETKAQDAKRKMEFPALMDATEMLADRLRDLEAKEKKEAYDKEREARRQLEGAPRHSASAADKKAARAKLRNVAPSMYNRQDLSTDSDGSIRVSPKAKPRRYSTVVPKSAPPTTVSVATTKSKSTTTGSTMTRSTTTTTTTVSCAKSACRRNKKGRGQNGRGQAPAAAAAKAAARFSSRSSKKLKKPNKKRSKASQTSQAVLRKQPPHAERERKQPAKKEQQKQLEPLCSRANCCMMQPCVKEEKRRHRKVSVSSQTSTAVFKRDDLIKSLDVLRRVYKKLAKSKNANGANVEALMKTLENFIQGMERKLETGEKLTKKDLEKLRSITEKTATIRRLGGVSLTTTVTITELVSMEGQDGRGEGEDEEDEGDRTMY